LGLLRGLASYESNDYKDINHGNLIALADFYGVTLDYLFCRTENREQINTPLTELHIIERYRPGEDALYLKVLQAAHVDDDEYFSRMVLDDINLIIRDVRALHKKDSESAPLTTVADELKENLSEEEFRWLIRILQKSKKMRTPISQRKKRK